MVGKSAAPKSTKASGPKSIADYVSSLKSELINSHSEAVSKVRVFSASSTYSFDALTTTTGKQEKEGRGPCLARESGRYRVSTQRAPEGV